MNDKLVTLWEKTLGVLCFALAAASQAFIVHTETALFFSVLFLLVGLYEFFCAVQTTRAVQGSPRNGRPGKLWAKATGTLGSILDVAGVDRLTANPLSPQAPKRHRRTEPVVAETAPLPSDEASATR